MRIASSFPGPERYCWLTDKGYEILTKPWDRPFVYMSREYPNGLTDKKYRDIITQNPGAKNFAWCTMRRNSRVLVKGRISHPDHDTIILDIWDKVVPNTESESVAFRDVAFLD